ncbi:peptidase T [Sandaracinomonas limnophila]|uniref:Peptidase T n=1 Tax=Sandaracinomonas limnophila TaxID=1862386 RepID=A0A437PXG0_9BACT|nr:peptidase T [Sandaracinomonas limnophila]RVU26954.1 peptidase T [Sandaracinomonas limnophila]
MNNLKQKISTYSYTSKDRFLRYVQIDTQSDPNASCFPSTEKQKNLGRILVEELQALGIANAHMDEFGYVYAFLPSNQSKKIPGIFFCSHMDTSPDCSGEGVKPIVHLNYQGQDLVLPDDPTVIIKLAEHSDLAEQIGNDIITASGKTLLGADNKAGLAEIMDAVAFWQQHPEVPHGDITVVFTPDEEVGRGTEHINLSNIKAEFGYTLDGEKRGHLENETFSADGAVLTIHGVSQHPGFAKNRMESAIKIAADIVANLPKNYLSPESTEEMEGFIHPVEISGSVEEAKIEFILRDFDKNQLIKQGELIQEITQKVLKSYPKSSFTYVQTEQYRNMNEVLKDRPEITQLALDAMKIAGLNPELKSIRGGTDGSRLTFMGLPCPNIFAGEHAFHSKQEWVSVQDMEKAVEVILRIAIQCVS